MGLVFKQLTFAYDARLVLRQINLSLPKAQLICLMGHNGSGKSTLLKILSGALKASSGEISLDDNPMLDENGLLKTRFRQHLGILFQHASSDDKLSVFANLYYGAMLMGIAKKDIKSVVFEAIEQADLLSYINEPVKKLSLGMKRRLEIYRTFMHHPKLVLLDEPTAGLDPKETERFYDFLSKYCFEHQALIIFSTHRSEEAIKADLLIMMHNGSIVANTKPQALLADLDFANISIDLKNIAEHNLIAFKEDVEKLSQKFISNISINRPSLKDAYHKILDQL